MKCHRVHILLLGAIAAAVPTLAAAQFPPPPPPPGPPPPPLQERWPESQMPQATRPQPPAARGAPAQRATQTKSDQAKPRPQDARTKPAQPAKPRPAANAVACSGVFAKDSSHLKLALKYDSRNVVYGQVDGPDGTKLNATILFPHDAGRRLEVLWANDAARSETSVIAINGKSQWVAPKGLRLGMPLAAVEKLNGRPFKLSGFAADGTAAVIGWENGALDVLPGGCKIGLRLREDSKAPQTARNAVTGDKQLMSNDANVRAVKPNIVEILIGY